MPKRHRQQRRDRRYERYWRRKKANDRTDAERYANEMYFGDVSPVHWLSGRIIEELRPMMDPNEREPTPAEFIDHAHPSAMQQVHDIRSRREKFLADASRDRDFYADRVWRHWRSAFRLLDIFTWHCIEVFAHIERRLDDWGAEDHLSRVMLRTARRGGRIAHEVLALLRAGYPEGAKARWRTLHEVAVTVTYLRVHGQEAAERIYAHDLYQTLEFNQQARSKSDRPDALSGEGFEWEVATIKELLDRFGPEFKNRYGWASGVVGKARPTFKDIEDKAGMAAWRRAYEDATYSAHSTSRPIHDELFRRHGDDVFAPTNWGLATPAIMTIRSILQVACAMLGIFVRSPDEQAADIQTALHLDAIAREAIDAWAQHEWPEWGLKHLPG